MEHERNHTGVKPYKCKHCDRCFTRSSLRKQHEITHSGLKPFKCMYCDKCFNRRSNCRQHELRHERKEDSSVQSLIVLVSVPTTNN